MLPVVGGGRDVGDVSSRGVLRLDAAEQAIEDSRSGVAPAAVMRDLHHVEGLQRQSHSGRGIGGPGQPANARVARQERRTVRERAV